MFQRDNEIRNVVLTGMESGDKATRHFLNRSLRKFRESGRYNSDNFHGALDYR